MDCSTPGFRAPHCLPEFVQTHVHGVGDAVQTSHPLSPPSLPALNLSLHKVFCLFVFVFVFVFFNKESALYIRRLKYWSFSFSISPSNAYSPVVSFRMDWFDLLVVEGTLKSLLQHHSSKASILS